MKLRTRPGSYALPDWLYLPILACVLPLFVVTLPLWASLVALRRRRERLTTMQRLLVESSRDAGGPSDSYTGGFGQGWRS